MGFLLTTTGTLPTVVFDDLGARKFVHPVVSYDLNHEYMIEEIRDSYDLGRMLDLGHVTALYGTTAITTSVQLAAVITLHTHDASDIVSGILNVSRGGTNSNIYTVSQLLRMNAAGTAFESSGLLVGSIARTDAASTYGLFLQKFRSGYFAISDTLNTGLYTFSGAANGANSVTLTIPATTVSDNLVLTNFIQILKNKTVDASLNTLINIGDASISSHTSTKITILNKLQLNNNIAYIDQANIFGAFDQTFQNLRLKIVDSFSINKYIIQTSALSADRNIILPVLTANDTFTFANVTQSMTNKTMSLTSNTLTDTGAALGGIVKHNGTKYVNVPIGLANYTLSVNAAGTDLTWSYPQAASLFINNASNLNTSSQVIAGNIMASMVLTTSVPGNYLLSFSGMVSAASVTNVEIEVWRQPFFGVAIAVPGTLRTWGNSAVTQKNLIGHTDFKITLNALDTITIRWRVTSAGTTGYMQNPSFTLIKTT